MAILDEATLDSIAARVFGQRSMTLEEAGQELALADLKETVLHIRGQMRAELDTLSDAAFERQPDDDEGREVWSAGQIISHICAAQAGMSPKVAQLLELESVEQTTVPETAIPDRSESIQALEQATSILRDVVNTVPDELDVVRTFEHERFGTLGVRGWLVLTAIHEHGHVRQLRSLDGR